LATGDLESEPERFGSGLGSPPTRSEPPRTHSRRMQPDPKGALPMSVTQSATARTTPALAPSAAVVSATALSKRYGEGECSIDALRGVSIEIEEGRLTAIMGPSG